MKAFIGFSAEFVMTFSEVALGVKTSWNAIVIRSCFICQKEQPVLHELKSEQKYFRLS